MKKNGRGIIAAQRVGKPYEKVAKTLQRAARNEIDTFTRKPWRGPGKTVDDADDRILLTFVNCPCNTKSD